VNHVARSDDFGKFAPEVGERHRVDVFGWELFPISPNPKSTSLL
jgi:hypothetical protein